MKKAMLILPLLVLGLMVSSSAAFAVPTLDGTIDTVAEWDNTGTGGNAYPYYLFLDDPSDAGIADGYDIDFVVLLQELNSFPAGDGDADAVAPFTGVGDNDGVYLAIKTVAAPLLADQAIGPPPASVSLVADFNGDGVINNAVGPYPADLQFVLYDYLGTDKLQVCVGVVFACVPEGPGNTDVPSSFHARGTDGIEFFFPAGFFGTPLNTQFPSSFIGTIIYDNGGNDDDDRISGSVVIPEPSTVMLTGLGLLGLLAYRRKIGS